MIKFSFLFLSFIFLNFSAFGKDYKLEELLDLAWQNSGNIKSAEYLALSQKNFANQQKYWDNPVVSIDKIGREDTYKVSQNIPFYGKLGKKYDIENAEYRILETRKNNLALFVKAEVFGLLYKYKALKNKIELSEKRLSQLSLVDNYLTKIAINSPTKRAQWHIVKNKIRLVERDLINFQNDLYQTWNAANVYLNLDKEPTNIDLEWLGDKNYQGKDFFTREAIENNLNLKEQKLLIEKYKSELSFAKVEQMPDFNVSISEQRESASRSGGAGQSSTGVGLSVSIPLFNRNQGKVSSAKSKISSQKHSYEFQRNQLTKLINGDINEYETHLKLSQNFSIKNISKITSRLAEANSDFKKGVLDFITYVELDSQEYQTIDAIFDTQIDLATSYAKLMIKIGSFTLPNSNRSKNDK